MSRAQSPGWTRVRILSLLFPRTNYEEPSRSGEQVFADIPRPTWYPSLDSIRFASMKATPSDPCGAKRKRIVQEKPAQVKWNSGANVKQEKVISRWSTFWLSVTTEDLFSRLKDWVVTYLAASQVHHSWRQPVASELWSLKQVLYFQQCFLADGLT